MSSTRDRTPPALRSILNLDISITNRLCDVVNKSCPDFEEKYKMYMKGLEISCHGIPWFIATFISIYMLRWIEAREVEINLLFALVYDVMIVAFVKAIVRRRRPPRNRSDEMFLARGPDKYSFPSGHASRAVFLALFFSNWAFPEMSIFLRLPLYIWALAVCISRVLLRRHFALDVTMGAVIGYAEFFLSGILWVGPEASKYLGDWIATSAEDEYN